MSSLREVKDRIASVRSTLKITSAMKLVASSKLRKAQRAIEALRPYSDELTRILAAAESSNPRCSTNISTDTDTGGIEPLVVLAFASNSSMCGAFNVNAAKKTLELASELGGNVELWAFGRKMAEALRKAGRPAARDCSLQVAHPSFGGVSALAEELRRRLAAGEISGVMLVYNHFVSAGRQEVVAEAYMGSCASARACNDAGSGVIPDSSDLYIIEPSRQELVQSLYPQVLALKLYAALLDSAAAEHAARMVAMQAATDNAEELLGELTLEYNKGRQQKITSEILDIVGGSIE